jgi:hypothetical protein
MVNMIKKDHSKARAERATGVWRTGPQEEGHTKPRARNIHMSASLDVTVRYY